MHLKAIAGSHNDGELRAEACLAALDVEEFFCAEVSAEACFSDGIFGQRHAHLGGQDGVTAVCDVGKRTTMHDGWGILCGLHEVWHEGVFEQNADSTGATHVLDGEWSAVIAVAEEDVLNAATEVFARSGQTEDSHDL